MNRIAALTRRRHTGLKPSAASMISAGILAVTGGPMLAFDLLASSNRIGVVLAVLASICLVAAIARPSWSRGPGTCAGLSLVSVAAGVRGGPAGFIVCAVLLILFLAGAEIAQSEAWRASWPAACVVHLPGALVDVIAVLVLLALAAAPIGGDLVSIIAIAATVPAGVALLILAADALKPRGRS